MKNLAALGLYERAIALDRGLLAQAEEAGARRRLVWSLLRLGRAQEALAAALPFERSAPPNTLARRLAGAAREYAALESGAERDALIAKLWVFTAAEARSLFARFVEAKPR